MNKFLVSILFLFTIAEAWSQNLHFYSLISLDMNKAEVMKILETDYKEKYRIDEYGIYVVTVKEDMTVFITIFNEKIYTLRVIIRNAVFSQFVNCSREIISKRGEPETCRPNGFEYRVEWYGKGNDPGRALVFSDEAPYTLEEILTYEK